MNVDSQAESWSNLGGNRAKLPLNALIIHVAIGFKGSREIARLVNATVASLVQSSNGRHGPMLRWNFDKCKTQIV